MLQEYTMPPPKEQMTKIKLIFTFMIVDFHLRDIDTQLCSHGNQSRTTGTSHCSWTLMGPSSSIETLLWTRAGGRREMFLLAL